jgi:glyoxylase-like metal-dependent hydrolase (beta-lactamase superfamily II)
VPRKPFASTADIAQQRTTLEELADGVYGYTAEGDPNVGCVLGDEAVLAVEARATPAMAREWIAEIRRLTDKPIRDLVLTHYHAVRVLGASAFGAERIIAHRATREWIAERGAQDMASEMARFPRLFREAHTIPGLTWPTEVFDESMTVDLGRRTVELRWLGRGHTAGDLVVWLPDDRVCFAGDLVEAQAAPYMGDAHIADWRSSTLDGVAALGAQSMVGGRGPAMRDAAAVAAGIEDTRRFLSTTFDLTAGVRERGGTLRDAFRVVYDALAPRYGGYPIFDHCMPFNIQRAWDELSGLDHPRIWTAERDREVWEALSD